MTPNEPEWLTRKRRIDTKLTKSVLAKAFRGELVPKDPSDEPASKLLERIKAQKEVSSVSPKKLKGEFSKIEARV